MKANSEKLVRVGLAVYRHYSELKYCGKVGKKYWKKKVQYFVKALWYTVGSESTHTSPCMYACYVEV